MPVFQYRKKPVVITACKWTGDNGEEMILFTEGNAAFEMAGDALYIPTLEGDLEASIGDFIIRGVAGEFYPCKPDIFAATYDFVKEQDVD